MGRYYVFECGKCGYNAEVSGGPDVGMACATTTIACSTCDKLYDVVTSNQPWEVKPD